MLHLQHHSSFMESMINNYVNVERSVFKITVENSTQIFFFFSGFDSVCELYISRWNEVHFLQPIFLLFSREARKNKIALSLGYHGNVVDLW